MSEEYKGVGAEEMEMRENMVEQKPEWLKKLFESEEHWKKVCQSEKLLVEKFVEKLRPGNENEIKIFDVRNEVLEMIYEDCKKCIEDECENCVRRKEDCKEKRSRFSAAYADHLKLTKRNKSNVLAWTEFGKIWAAKDLLDYDYDASLLMNYVYCKLFDQKIEESHGYEYVIVKDGEKYRGDTMNSFQTTVNQFRKLFGGKYFVKLVQTKRKGWTLEKKGNIDQDKYFFTPWEYFYCDPSNYKKKPLPQYITNFMKVVYSIGNFIPAPRVCNNPRGSGATRDYWDLALKCIYEWYSCENKDYIDALLKKDQEVVSTYINWLREFDNWDDFVEKNFMQPFAEKKGDGKYGEPYELWKKPNELRKNHFSCIEISDEKKVVIDEKKVCPQEEWQFEQFFVNARIRILERGELMAKELIKLVAPNTDQPQ